MRYNENVKKNNAIDNEALPDREAILALAEFAHYGQVDKLGQPYVCHLLEVEERVLLVPSYALLTEREKAIALLLALLHDIVEDTDVTLDDLFEQGLPGDLVNGVYLMTHIGRTPRGPYYDALYPNRVARVVKLADMAHNASPERLLHLPEATRVRLENKYGKGATRLVADYPDDAAWFAAATGLDVRP